jgi:hypothetical protein
LHAFNFAPTPLGYETCDKCEITSNSNQVHNHIPCEFWSLYENLTHHQSEYYLSCQMSHRSPSPHHNKIKYVLIVELIHLLSTWTLQLSLFIEPRMVNTYLSTHYNLSLKHIYFFMLILKISSNHTSLTYRCLIKISERISPIDLISIIHCCCAKLFIFLVN